MPSIIKRGNYSYRLTVSLKRDSKGKKKYKSKTVTVDKNLTPTQKEKFLEEQYSIFEQSVRAGKYLDNKIPLIYFARKWIDDMEEINHLAKSTAERYKAFLVDIEDYFDNTRIIDITVPMVNDFYQHLRNIDRRRDSTYIAKDLLIEKICSMNSKRDEIARKLNIGTTTLNILLKKNNISIKTAKKICSYFDYKLNKLFSPASENVKLSENTILHYHQFLNSVMEEAVKSLIINYNPCRNVRKPKKRVREIQYLDIEQAQTLLTYINDKARQPYKTIIPLYILSGCRRSELLALEWDDVDFINLTINIKKALLHSPEAGFYIKEPKTEKSKRLLYFDESIKNLLYEYKEWQKTFLNDSKIIFCKENGEYLHPDTISAWLRKFIINNNLPKINIQGLRHTNATLLISQGLDIKTVSNRLGHSNTTTTLNVYTHPTESGNKKAAKVLSNLLSN